MANSNCPSGVGDLRKPPHSTNYWQKLLKIPWKESCFWYYPKNTFSFWNPTTPGHFQLRLTRKASSLCLVNFHCHKKTQEPALLKATKNHWKIKNLKETEWRRELKRRCTCHHHSSLIKRYHICVKRYQKIRHYTKPDQDLTGHHTLFHIVVIHSYMLEIKREETRKKSSKLFLSSMSSDMSHLQTIHTSSFYFRALHIWTKTTIKP